MITIQQNVPLAPFTSFDIGGPARFFTTARSVDELREALLFARREKVPFAILGGGTNLLICDDGFEGMVIRLKLEGLAASGHHVKAEAGIDLTGLVHLTAQWGLSGMESLAGIPGLVGGAVRGNAGAYGSSIGELLETACVLHAETLELMEMSRGECCFSYRDSRFKRDPRFIVVSALLALSPDDPVEIADRVAATIARRTAKNLQCERSVGSFFMNPVVSDPRLIGRFESDQRVRCRESRIPAGWLIDKAGLRNTRVGAAIVSSLHANYLVNTGTASAEEVVRLARLIKGRVRDVMGVQLQEEVSCLGFQGLHPEPAGVPDPAQSP